MMMGDSDMGLMILSGVGLLLAVALFLLNVILLKQRGKQPETSTNVLDRLARPLIARRLARKYDLSTAYVNEVLRLNDHVECGKLSLDACVREAHRLGEQYPDEYKRVMKSLQEDK